MCWNKLTVKITDLSVKCSAIVNDDLVIKVFVGSNELTPNDLNWVLTNDQKLTCWSQLENILSRYGSGSPVQVNSQEFYISKAIKQHR